MTSTLGRRRYNEDEGNEGATRQTGGYAGKRARQSFGEQKLMSPDDELEAMILRFGAQEPTAILAGVSAFVDTLPHADKHEQQAALVRIIVNCAQYLPTRITFYSTMVGLLNATNHRLGATIVDAILAAARERLLVGEYDYALNCLLFLSDLVNCHVVSCRSALTLLQTLTNELQKDTPQARRDFYTQCVLHSLVYCGHALLLFSVSDVDAILQQCNNYIQQRTLTHVHMLQVWPGDETITQHDRLDLLWRQMETLRADKFQDYVLQRPYIAPSLRARFDDVLQHNISTFLPPQHHINAEYPLPFVVFRIIQTSDVDVTTVKYAKPLPDINAIESFLVEQDIRWLVYTWYTSRKDLTNALLQYALNDTIPYLYSLVETLIGDMLRVPYSPLPLCAYASTLVELEKSAEYGARITPIITTVCQRLYTSMPTMQPMCIDRLAEWLSLHMSQHNYQYQWKDWDNVIELDALQPQRMFVRECLSRVMRLSYYGRIQHIVPTTLAPLYPENPQINFKYVQDGGELLPGADFARELEEQLQSRADAPKIIEFMRTFDGIDNKSNIHGYNEVAIDVFTSVLLNLCSKSLQYTVSGLTKYVSVFNSLIGGIEEAQMVLLETVHTLWRTNHQMLTFVIDKFIKMSVLDLGVIVRFIFTSTRMEHDIQRQWTWDLLTNVMTKYTRQMKITTKALEHATVTCRETQNLIDSLSDIDAVGGDDDENETRLEKARQTLQEATDEREKMQNTLEHLHTAQSNLIMTLFQLHIDAAKQTEQLEQFLFSTDLSPSILEVFHQFRALRR